MRVSVAGAREGRSLSVNMTRAIQLAAQEAVRAIHLYVINIIIGYIASNTLFPRSYLVFPKLMNPCDGSSLTFSHSLQSPTKPSFSSSPD